MTTDSDEGVMAFVELENDSHVDFVGTARLCDEQVDRFEVIGELMQPKSSQESAQVLIEQALNP